MIKNKIILTSLVSLCFAMPAFAEFTAGQQIADENGLLNGMACDEDTLGVTQDTANLEAIWTANTYSITYKCDANNPLPALFVLQQASQVDCNEDPTNDECITPTHAVYDKIFTFADKGMNCVNPGYQQTGWLCKNASDANATATRYNLGATLEPWDLTYNLACVAEWTPNTIHLDWYDRGVKQTVSQSVGECTYNDASTLNLPSAPAARAGYTFSGWKLFDICTTLNSKNTCNMNASCFWDGDENNGTCFNINSKIGECEEINDSTQCSNTAGCYYNELGQACIVSACPDMTQEQCGVHSECSWNERMQMCEEYSYVLQILG